MAEAPVLPRTTAPRRQAGRASSALPGARDARRYWLVLTGLVLLALVFGIGLVVWGNPMEPGTAGFWRIVALRGKNVLVMLVVAFCQAMATDRKSTRLNSSHVAISYAVFCLKKKKADISLQQYCKGHETGSS